MNAPVTSFGDSRKSSPSLDITTFLFIYLLIFFIWLIAPTDYLTGFMDGPAHGDADNCLLRESFGPCCPFNIPSQLSLLKNLEDEVMGNLWAILYHSAITEKSQHGGVRTAS